MKAACETLANLCVLQLYDDRTNACINYQTILAARLDKGVAGVTTRSATLPWLLYPSGGDSICLDESLQRRMHLSNDQLEYYLASYTINGTFLGYSPLDTLLNYCTRSSPYSSLGGGSASSTSWQYFANSQRIFSE